MRNVLIAIAMASTAIGGVAFAQTDMPQSGQMPPPSGQMPPRGGGMRGMGGGGMMAADTNHDGIITRDEAIAAADRRFDMIDANHDGRITPDEMMAYRDQMMARRGGGDNAPPPPPGGAKHAPGMGRRADPNGDGVITRDEYRARAMERFDRMDANHDGKIDRTEMANLREMRQVDRRENQGGQTPPPPGQQ